MSITWAVLRSLPVGVCVFCVAFLAAWLGARDLPQFSIGRTVTLGTLNNLSRCVEKHREATGSIPATLSELKDVAGGMCIVDDVGRILDGWGYPLTYSQSGDGFEIWSRGQDGVVGGIGLDCDICSDGRGFDESLPTLRQFADCAPIEKICAICLISALLSIVASCVMLTKPRVVAGVRSTACGIVLTVVSSLMIAIFLLVTHVMLGH